MCKLLIEKKKKTDKPLENVIVNEEPEVAKETI